MLHLWFQLKAQIFSCLYNSFAAFDGNSLDVGANAEISSDTTQACQTPATLSVDTPRKRRLRKMLKAKKNKISALSSKLAGRKSSFPTSPIKSTGKRIQKAFQLLEGVLPSNLLDFKKKQAHLSNKKARGKRYDNNFKAWALSLYHVSGKAYRLLQKLFNLPSKRTLTSIVSKFASNTGFNEKSLFVLKQRIEALPPSGKFRALLMDEISLKSHLYYDAAKDSLVGLKIMVVKPLQVWLPHLPWFLWLEAFF